MGIDSQLQCPKHWISEKILAMKMCITRWLASTKCHFQQYDDRKIFCKNCFRSFGFFPNHFVVYVYIGIISGMILKYNMHKSHYYKCISM